MTIEILDRYYAISEWDKLERELIIDKDRKAIICQIDNIVVVIISMEVLWQFEMDDGFTVGQDGEYMCNINKNSFGNTVDINQAKISDNYLAICSGDKRRLRYSRVGMFKNISINLLIEQVKELIEEFKKRLQSPSHKNRGRYFNFNKTNNQYENENEIYCIY
jgi:hypothetical protein